MVRVICCACCWRSGVESELTDILQRVLCLNQQLRYVKARERDGDSSTVRKKTISES
jgi:hypothetical protein